MANLLLPEMVRNVKAKARDRLLLTWALLLTATAIVAALALLPSFLVLRIMEPGDRTALEKVREDKQGLQELAQSQAILKDLANVVAATSSPSRAIREALMARPKGITVHNVTYSGSPATLVISGNGASRDVISEYRENLLKDKRFMSVSIPVSALVGAEESGAFSATVITNY
ncbi:MAG: hypothetical protein RIQ56_813 [Candidatus Parcubacteria bacterium]|jgi:hypothetical protein